MPCHPRGSFSACKGRTDRQYPRARDQLLVSCSFPKVEPTNNGCRRHPTQSHQWLSRHVATEYETAVRSAVDTARLAGAGSFHTMPSNHRLITPSRILATKGRG